MRAPLAAGFAAGLLASGACFSAPSADVQFSCDLKTAPACPPDYSCQDDGCCHRDGSDVDANRGGCRLVNTSGLTDSATGTDSTTTGTDSATTGTSDPTTTSGTDSTGTDSTSGTGTETGTETGTGPVTGSTSG